MSDAETPSPTKPRPRLLSKAVMGFLNLCLGGLTVLVLMGGAAVLYLKNYPVTAPAWAQSMIEARIAKELPQNRVSFGEMAFVMEEGWKPRVRLRNVALRGFDGQEIIRFNEFKASFASDALIKGKVQPIQITLSGIVARLRRDKDGSVALQAGISGPAPARQAATLPQLIGQVDVLLQDPALSALKGIDLRALTLRYEDARSGRVWTVDGGRLVLTRDADDLNIAADLAVLDGGVGVTTLTASYSSRIGDTAATFGVAFDEVSAQDIAAQGPAFAWLDVLQAPISGSVRTGLQEGGSFTPLAASLQIGAGVVRPNPATDPIPFEGARSYFSYDPSEGLLRFDELSVQSKWITGQATGTAVLGLDVSRSTLTDLVGQITLSGLSANPGGLYPAPVQMTEADIDFQLELDPFRITLGRAQISDAGQVLSADGFVEAGPEGWQLALDAHLDALKPDRLLALWPERVKPRTRKWLVENLRAGVMHNIDVAFRRSPGVEPQSYLAFDFVDAEVRFSKTLPLIKGGTGHFSREGARLVVTMDNGSLTPPEGGTIQLTGSSFIIPDVRVKDGAPAIARVAARAPIPAVLSLLNMPPLSVMDKARLPVALAQGDALVTGALALPLGPERPKKIEYYMEGELRGVRSDVLVKDRRVAAETLAIFADNAGFTLTGAGTLDDVPFDGSYAQPVGRDAGPGKLKGQVPLTAQSLATFGVKLPPGSLEGRARGDIAMTIARGAPPRLTLTSDLVGLRIAVPQVSWSKPAARAGKLALDVTLGGGLRVDRLEVSGPGLSARGDVTFKNGATLDRLRFDQLKVGNWLDVPLDLVGRGPGRTLQVQLRGGALDLRRATFGSGKPDPSAPPMLVQLDRLTITDTIALNGLQGEFETAKGLDGNFRAALNGKAPVQGRVVPQDGRSAVRLTSTDAGGVMRAAGLLKQVVGGNLSLLLLPVGSGGAFDGRLEVGDVRIKDAPGIAALLNAISVVGLINELNGDGIYFDNVEASFRLTPNLLTLSGASAVGASMGLSMDGNYALDTGQIAMQGVISPVFLLNGIGSVFTRKGEGLIGSNYALNGSAKEPSVSVNPLSALTPAMFRNIFRKPPPDLPAVEGVTESTLPENTAAPQRPVARSYEGR